MKLPASDELSPGIRKWKPYPGYKDSGVEWLGTIPEHWNVSTLKLLAPTINRGKSPDYVEDGGIPVINQACVYWEGLHLENVKYDSGKNGNNGKGRLFPGDVLVNSTGTGTLGRASVFRREQTYFADGHVTVVRLNQTAELPEYLFYLLQTQIYQGFIYSTLVSGSTNQIELSRESFRATPIIVPPFTEQIAIAAFLDQETAKIDALVAKKERLIALLQEKRAAFITRAVTKGLDPNISMNVSGVGWLGEIPAHWPRPRKLSSIASSRKHSFVNGPFGSDLLTSEITDQGIPVVYIRDLSGGCYRRKSVAHLTPEKAKQLDFCRVDPGDVLIAKVGDPPGEAAVYPNGEPSGVVTQDVIRIRVNDSIVSAGYLVFFLNSIVGRALVENIAIESTRMRVSLGDYKNSLCLIPPLVEQRIIVQFLDRETNKIDALIARIREGIDKLKEYRTALISAAVTGKIDVREKM